MRYKLSYVDDIEGAPAWWLIAGKAIHSATEALDADGTLDVHKVFNSELDKAHDEIVGQFSQPFMKSSQSKETWQANGPEHIIRWTEWLRDSAFAIVENQDGKKAIELPLDIQICDTQFVGYIDRVLHDPMGLCIVDLKTGSKQPENTLQLGFYRYAMRKQYGVTIDRGAFFMTKNGKLLEYDISGYTDEIIESYVATLVKAKEQDMYLANPGGHCFTCSVKDSCPIYSIGVRK